MTDNFRFDADAAPTSGLAMIGLWRADRRPAEHGSRRAFGRNVHALLRG